MPDGCLPRIGNPVTLETFIGGGILLLCFYLLISFIGMVLFFLAAPHILKFMMDRMSKVFDR
jgi:hypothetical protein